MLHGTMILNLRLPNISSSVHTLQVDNTKVCPIDILLTPEVPNEAYTTTFINITTGHLIQDLWIREGGIRCFTSCPQFPHQDTVRPDVRLATKSRVSDNLWGGPLDWKLCPFRCSVLIVDNKPAESSTVSSFLTAVNALFVIHRKIFTYMVYTHCINKLNIEWGNGFGHGFLFPHPGSSVSKCYHL